MKRTLWLVVDHPMQIIDAMGIRIYYKKKFDVKLLVSKHHYWDVFEMSDIKDWFDEIYFFPRINFSWILPREIINIVKNKLDINKLNIQNKDVFLVFSENVFLESLLFNKYPSVKRIRLFAYHLFKRYHGVNFENRNKWEEKLISKLWSATLIPFFNLEPIKYYKNLHDWHAYRINYVRQPSEIFDHILVLRQNGQEIKKSNQIYELSPLVFETLKKETKKKSKFIFFFGDSLKKYDAYHIDFTNKCLRYIEKYHPHKKLLYKPHPNDVLEQKHIKLGKFKIFGMKLPSELLLLKYGSNIDHIYSIASVSLKNSLQFGFRNVHAFFKLYDRFDPELKLALINQFGPIMNVNNFFVTDFNKPPQKYQIKRFEVSRVKNVLRKLDGTIEQMNIVRLKKT